MHDPKLYEAQSPENISREELITALSGLSPLSRSIITDELIKTHQDTTMEYHRNEDRDIQKGLWEEIQCLNFLIAACIRANDEFKEISDRNHNSNDES